MWNFSFKGIAQDTIQLTIGPSSTLIHEGGGNLIFGGQNTVTSLNSFGGNIEDRDGIAVLKGRTLFNYLATSNNPNANNPYTRGGIIAQFHILEIDHPNETSKILTNNGSVLVQNYVEPVNGSFQSNNGQLVLKSTKYSALYNGKLEYYGIPSLVKLSACYNGVPKGQITGNVYLERPISTANYTNRLLSPGLIPNKTIFDSYQESLNNFSGFGTHIFKNGASGTDGFEIHSAYSPDGTIKSFNNNSHNWSNFSSTKTLNENWGLTKGIYINVQGDRTYIPGSNPLDAINSSSRYTVLRTYGQLNQCDIGLENLPNDANTVNQKIILVGNPFWSYINFGLSNNLGIEYNQDVKPEYTQYNPYASGTGNNTGSFITTNLANPFPGDKDYVLQPGQSVFLTLMGPSPVLKFHPEASYIDTTYDAKFTSFGLKEAINSEHIVVEGLVKTHINQTYNETPFAKVRVSYNDLFTNEIGKEDSYLHFENSFENLSIQKVSKKLVIEGRKTLAAIDTIQFNLKNLFNVPDTDKENIKYAFKINRDNYNKDDILVLFDNNNKIYREILPNTNLIYPLEINPSNTETSDFFLLVLKKQYRKLIDGKLNWKDNEVYVFPNPTVDKVVVSYRYIKGSTVELYNYSGEKLQTREIAKDAQLIEDGDLIDLTNYPAGSYLIKVTSPDGTIFTKKVIKY